MGSLLAQGSCICWKEEPAPGRGLPPAEGARALSRKPPRTGLCADIPLGWAEAECCHSDGPGAERGNVASVTAGSEAAVTLHPAVVLQLPGSQQGRAGLVASSISPGPALRMSAF